MGRQVPKIRVFLSSPGDVTDERTIVRKVLNDLPYDPLLRGAVSFEVVAWDIPGAPGLDARMTPQEALNAGLPLPSECDIVVGILWSRVGTPFELKGKTYASGTLYELEEARQGSGDLLIYRRQEQITLDPSDTDVLDKLEQWRAVEEFFSTFKNDRGDAVSGYNSYQTPSELGDLLTDHLKQILVRSYSPESADATQIPRWSGSPFPGLRAFTTVDAPIFFGRGRETDELIRQVANERVTLVMGASGSGKSSLVGAGLLPRLQAGALPGSEHWRIPNYVKNRKRWQGMRFSPAEFGDNPFLAFATKFSEFKTLDPTQTAHTLSVEPWTIDALVEELTDDGMTLLVFVDQFEELFTSVAESYVAPFIDLLNHPNVGMRWIITVRSDFYHRCVNIPALARLLERGQFPLSVPTDTLLDMITRPADRAFVEFDEGLTWRILEDTGHEPGSLALMAYALDELYTIADQRGDRRMSTSDYEAMGGVQGAIGKRAESVFVKLPYTPDERIASLQHVFRELIEVDERGVATRRRAAVSTVTQDPRDAAMIDAFVEARLLTTSEGEQGGQVEMAHEALLRNWRRLAQWIQTVQSDLLLLRQMRGAAQEWAANGHKHDYLWWGERGVEAQAMLKRLRPTLDELETRFARPESEHLLEELEIGATTHIRREAVGQRLLALGDPRSGIACVGGLPDLVWCAVAPPADTTEYEFFDHEEKSFGTYAVHEFFIAMYPITNAQFQPFLDAKDGVCNADWWRDFEETTQKAESSTQSGSNYPRDSVSWHLAVAFCRWLNTKLSADRLPAVADPEGWEIRLPHEWEWQYAAGGEDQTKAFPWGEWDPTKCNLKEAGIGRSMSVGLYPDGRAPCGALDMIGNVREWCLNPHKTPDTIEFGGKKPRALRGGSIYQDYLRAFVRYRASMGPKNPSREAAFRLAYGPKLMGTVGSE